MLSEGRWIPDSRSSLAVIKCVCFFVGHVLQRFLLPIESLRYGRLIVVSSGSVWSGPPVRDLVTRTIKLIADSGSRILLFVACGSMCPHGVFIWHYGFITPSSNPAGRISCWCVVIRTSTDSELPLSASQSPGQTRIYLG